ncbi:cobalt-precorrin-8 methylmutase [Methanobrevibacter filiformis]|uniref:Precorrin-8X methylmutase n=1 Tax=Methanobrevibacter filiformis TaxID=55758 RepID=A0A165Z874_9EURY|nr:cobalt-precorrin-8 methylmutase [Methanobrevibacter filiformis]KZX10376.1 precorrin-8X methylmutase [Methanobrevibacter filiformis]
MFMGASTEEGKLIAEKSRIIVKSLIKDQIEEIDPTEADIIERIVHSTADPEYAKLVQFHPKFVENAIDSLKANEDILTDINMVKSGITQYDGDVDCFIKNDEVIKIAKEFDITRASAAIQYASDIGFKGIIVIGNAPTALFKAIELFESNKLNVKAIVGAPVGFVGAADSKEALIHSNIPSIVTKGPKGGTPVAVASINSLIRLVKLNY